MKHKSAWHRAKHTRYYSEDRLAKNKARKAATHARHVARNQHKHPTRGGVEAP